MAAPIVFADLSRHDTHSKYAFDGSIAVSDGDLMYHDTNDVKPASSQTDQVGETLNQRLFARNFAGIADFAKLSTDTNAETGIRVCDHAIAEYDCASATFEVDDLLAVDEASSGTALEDQKLVKVTDPSLAIARCVKREANAVTRVTVEIGPRVNLVRFSRNLFGLNALGSNAETLTGNKTLDTADAVIQVLDPGGSGRDVTLPAESAGMTFLIFNSADAAEVLTIKNDGGGTVCTPTQAEAAIVVSDGTTYRGIVGGTG